MPERIRSTLSKGLARSLGSVRAFDCPSCAIRRQAPTRAIINVDKTTSTIRSGYLLSSASSVTRLYTTSTITAGTTIPPQLKALHNALSEVKKASIEQVNLSRLQLALRGLESETPLIRVAILGLDNANSARKLIQLLLADPLSSREDWEDILEGHDSDLSRGLLIRYGEISEIIINDLLPSITIRSSILKNGNLELLVSSIGSESDLTRTTHSAETFLVPTVTIQTSHSGRHNVVRYPVHRSIICGTGVDGLLAFSTLIGRSDLKNEAASVRGAIELSVTDSKRDNDRVFFVDINSASTALNKIRDSVQNATEYERGWNSSGVQPVIDWLESLSSPKDQALNTVLVPLIESLLDAADEGVLARDTKAMLAQTQGVVPQEVRSELEHDVAAWSERAHSELRSSLEAGFASPRWRGLAWWKLFWRVDDVSMITSEILEKRFLRHAEQEVVWTSGKYQQAGLLEEHATNITPGQSTTSPWPTQISDMRTKLLSTTVPSLQALAQNLVFFSASTTTLTSALSALTYVSVPSASIYESCTLAAIGLIFSLRRQQKKWGIARGFWEEEVREEGRASLRETEHLLRQIVREGGKNVEELNDDRARKVVDRARKALEDVKA